MNRKVFCTSYFLNSFLAYVCLWFLQCPYLFIFFLFHYHIFPREQAWAHFFCLAVEFFCLGSYCTIHLDLWGAALKWTETVAVEDELSAGHPAQKNISSHQVLLVTVKYIFSDVLELYILTILAIILFSRKFVRFPLLSVT